MKQQRPFTKEFEDEAVRLVQTSGRTQREIAEDLGVGLSTLVRWLSRSRDRAAEAPGGSASPDMAAELKRKANGILISMSGRGNCFDNAMVETFFKTLKSVLVWRTAFETRADAAAAIGRYIDGFYNPVRRHSALDFTIPAQFERMAAT
jgi:transposase InsO family protein